MILGLDASSVMIGYCLLDIDGNYVEVGHIDLHKCENLYKKLLMFDEFFKKLIIIYNIKTVVIEQPALMFQKASTAHVMALLQRWNGFICSQIFLTSNKEPISISAASARKIVGIKIPKGIKGKKTKEYILSYVKELNIIPQSHWIYKKTGMPKDYHFDECDAVIIAKAGFLLEKNKSH